MRRRGYECGGTRLRLEARVTHGLAIGSVGNIENLAPLALDVNFVPLRIEIGHNVGPTIIVYPGVRGIVELFPSLRIDSGLLKAK